VKSAEGVESCTLEVSVDPATGAVTATQRKGRSLSEGWAVFWGRLQVAFVLLLPFILIGLWYASGYVSEWYNDRQAALWLREFYMKNAPEVTVVECFFSCALSHSLLSALSTCLTEIAGRGVRSSHARQVQGPAVPVVAEPGAHLQGQVARAAWSAGRSGWGRLKNIRALLVTVLKFN
jgi:hypothetical protein